MNLESNFFRPVRQFFQTDIFQSRPSSDIPNTLWTFIWYYTCQFKALLLAMVFLYGGLAITNSTLFWYVGELVQDGQYTLAMIVLGVGVMLGWLCFHFLSDVTNLLVFRPYMSNRIFRQLYWHTCKHSIAYFQNDFSGRLSTKVNQTANSVREFILTVVNVFLYIGTFFITNIWFMQRVHMAFAVAPLLWGIGFIIVIKWLSSKLRRRAKEQAESTSILRGHVVDSFSNIIATKYFNRGDFEESRMIRLLENQSHANFRTMSVMWSISTLVNVLNTFLLTATVAVGYWLIEYQQIVGIESLAMTLPMILQSVMQSRRLMFEASRLSETVGTIEDGVHTLLVPHTVQDEPHAKDLLITPQTASIEFQNVCFAYHQASEPVLKDFHLTIKAGEKVGLVGSSGAGKTTLINLILRSYDIDSGQILVANQDIAHLKQNHLRSHISIITQESYLFNRSVKDNIAYGRSDVSDDEIIDAAKQAFAHEFIMELLDHRGNKGYDARVGERGVKLSGGQKQRLNIARSILKNATILLMDEATSALDSESEYAIQQALSSIIQGKTVLMIAHRLSTLLLMDKLVVMDQGQIVEMGSHQELLQKTDGIYAKLWAMQSGGFLPEPDTL